MSEWKPIETAPERGDVLLYYPPVKSGRTELREWFNIAHPRSTPHRRPTHWMPLPDPPTP